MERIKRFIFMRDLGMLQKLIISFLIVFILPVSLIAVISYENYTRSIKTTTTAYVMQMSTEVINRLDTTFSELKSVTIIPLLLPDFQDIMVSGGEYTKKFNALKPYLNVINSSYKEKYTTYFFDNDGNIFSGNYSNPTYGRKDTEHFYRQVKQLAEQAQGGFVMLGPEIVTDITGQDKYLLTFARSIRNTTVPTYKPVGIIAIDVDMSVFSNTIQNLDRITNGETVIIDTGSKIIYESSYTLINQTYSRNDVLTRATGDSGSFSLQTNGENSVYIYSTLPHTRWKMLVRIPSRVLYQVAVTNSKIVIVISALTTALAILIYWAMAITLTKPLRKLSHLMKRLQKGDLEVHFDVKYQDEVGMVATSFNNMVVQIKNLINEVYISKLRKQQAELDVLQGQINPHFIYNTLETIRMLSILSGNSELAAISSTFGSMLRYSINKGNEIVTVHDEIDNLKKYVYLQNKRFSNKFTLHIHIPESHLQYQTIKLLFQPIVENSILHGLEKKKGHGNIEIVSREEQNSLIFMIKDDGDGISPDHLEQINRDINTINVLAENREHIGIRNVNERIKLYYGEEYGLTLSSTKGIGTEVRLMLPAVDKG